MVTAETAVAACWCKTNAHPCWFPAWHEVSHSKSNWKSIGNRTLWANIWGYSCPRKSVPQTRTRGAQTRWEGGRGEGVIRAQSASPSPNHRISISIARGNNPYLVSRLARTVSWKRERWECTERGGTFSISIFRHNHRSGVSFLLTPCMML